MPVASIDLLASARLWTIQKNPRPRIVVKMLVKAPRIFTGREWLSNATVQIKDGVFNAILEGDKGAAGTPDTLLESGFLCASFVDLQIYGGGGILFSNTPSEESIRRTFEEHVNTGTTHFQITLNCSSEETIWEAIRTCKDYMNSGGKGLIGLHLEGPFFNPVRRGAHLLENLTKPDVEFCQRLVEACAGLPTYMTIAPEMFDPESLDVLLASPIKLSVGHSDATHAQANAAFERGILRVTHLFNAQSQWTSRALGIVGATMDHPEARASIVVDGLHVDFASVRMAKKLMGDRLFLITDAVTEDLSGPYEFSKRGGDRFTDANGVLSGSALTMIEAVRNCVKKVGISVEEALRMATFYPAEVVGLDASLGTLEVGKEASFLWLSDELEVKAVWIKGERQF